MAIGANDNMDDLLAKISMDTAELVNGVQLSMDGSFVSSQVKSIKQLLKLFQQWKEAVNMLKMACDNLKYQEDAQTAEEDLTNLLKSNINGVTEGNGSLTIDLTVDIKSAFDNLGRAIKFGATCPVCGHHIQYLPPGCYCSVQCMLYDLTKKIAKFLMTPNERYKNEISVIKNIIKILDLTSLTINAITAIPDLIKELATLPEEYKQYVLQKINEGFCELQVIIQKLMIKKNKLLAKILKKINFGVIAKPIAAMYSAIQTVIEALDALDLAFNTWYDTTMTTLNALKVSGMQIDADGFAWSLTPRSYISPLPYTAPDAGKIFVNLPGGSAMGAIEALKAAMPSALLSINFEAVDAAIQAAFPPLTTVDYYLEPQLFKIRYLLSDQSDLVRQIRQQLEDLLKGGPDYIPKFENLLPVKKYTLLGKEMWLPNFGYIWFLMGLADAWGPHSKSLVGSIMNPAI